MSKKMALSATNGPADEPEPEEGERLKERAA